MDNQRTASNTYALDKALVRIYSDDMKPITPSALRADIYNILDQVLETGKAVVIERNGKRLRIVPEESESQVAGFFVSNDLVIGDPDELDKISWDKEWSGEI